MERTKTDLEELLTCLLVLNLGTWQQDPVLAGRMTKGQRISQFSKDSLRSKTVLLVDDYHSVRLMIREMLESQGLRVLEASCGADAVRIARSYPENLDLLLTDLEMPEMSGWECAKEIADLRPGIRVLYMSAGMNLQDCENCREKPSGTYFIQKPFKLADLKPLLLAILPE